MKTVILCGGRGTRIMEETKVIPKPLVKIGSKPILWHIIKYFYSFGYSDFILASGYKSKIIEEYFKKNKINNCNIKVINTGLNTLTGGRLLRLKKYFKKDETFMMTYGDGVSNINLDKLLKFHNKQKKISTLTAVRPPVRFGELKINFKNLVVSFIEKNQSSANWINGGFFVLNSRVFNFIKDDKTIFEREPISKLAKSKELNAYKHFKFWQCMDTLRDKILLNKIWKTKKAPWKKW
jgi:glucose-1-phosphate cytidylyltransferase